MKKSFIPLRLSLAMDISLSAYSSNILGSRCSLALDKLLLDTLAPNPRWWNIFRKGASEVTKSLRLSLLESWPYIKTRRWFQHVNDFTHLLPSYLFTRQSKDRLGKNLRLEWRRTDLCAYFTMCLQFVTFDYSRTKVQIWKVHVKFTPVKVWYNANLSEC